MKITEKKIISLLLLLGAVTQLSALSHPRQVIFDEVHFGKFVTAYCCTGENIFDIHPPHAKLLIAGTAWLAGYRGGQPFASIGEAYEADVPVAALRLVPALMGIILPALLFILARQMGARRELALLAGWLVLFDTAFTVQSRVISLDGLLLVGTFGALSAWLVIARRNDPSLFRYWILAGALVGLAVGAKFTGLIAPGLLLLLFLYHIAKRVAAADVKRWIGGLGVAVLSALIVYSLGWILHFALLSQPGSGDAFRDPNMVGFWPARVLSETVELHRIMLSANANLEATHPYASYWWTWPVMGRPVFYWQNAHQLIYLFGNPIVWWLALLILVTAVISAVISYGEGKKQRTTLLAIAVLGYLASFVPLMQVTRPLFLYHYFTPLIFSILIGVLWLEDATSKQWNKAQWRAYLGVLVLVGLSFLYFSPLAYGLSLSSGHDHLFWFAQWR